MKKKQYYVSIRSIVFILFILFGISNTTSTTNAKSVKSPTNEKSYNAPSQDTGPLGPFGMPLTDIDTIIMPPVDAQKLLEEGNTIPLGEPPRFAVSINSQISPSTHGTWETLVDGTQIWRLHIISENALSLSFGFTSYEMPLGGQLYIYTPDYSQILGPFTYLDNEEHGQLWSPLLISDEAIIEVSLPESSVPQLNLELTSVNHGYVASFGTTEKSGSCNIDVSCSVGDAWSNEIRSVGQYIFTEDGYSYVCTGTLVNNTSQNRIPYFLTANHCVNNSTVAATVVVYWNYENPTCRVVGSAENGTPISRFGFPNQTGAFLRATNAVSDFALLELDDNVSEGINAYWSGWDHSGNTANSAIGIHHPQGQEKRISFENDPITITSYLGTSMPGNSSHIRITDWDAGTTEGGSSGSALFDQNHHIIGQLHGGYAACGNDSSDWYGRFYTSWTGSGTNETRLSNWLDPINSGVITLNGLDSTNLDIYEPDNASGQASWIYSEVPQTHSIIPSTDEDWVKFQLSNESAVLLETNGTTSSDTRMRLYDNNLVQIEFSDDEGIGEYSFIDRVCDIDALPAGTYYVKIDEYGNNNEISDYGLSFIAKDCPSTSINISIATERQGSYLLASQGSKRVNYAGVDAGPVKIESTNDVPIIAALREAYYVSGQIESFVQLMGLPAESLSTTYYFPAYNNVSLDDQLRFGNVGNTATTVTVTIAGVVRGTYNLNPGEAKRVNYAGLDAGPVVVQSSGGVPIIAALRDAYYVDGRLESFAQLMGLPQEKLSTKYYFPAYNNVSLDGQLRFGNVGNASTTVTVTIAGVVRGTYNLNPNESKRVNYAGLDAGPVVVESSGGVPITAALRDAYFVDGKLVSFIQLMGLPQEQLSTTYNFPAYNNVSLDGQLRFGNVGNTATTVTVTIAGVVRGTYNLNPSEAKRVNYVGLDAGPVVIQSSGGVPIIAALRDAYFVNGKVESFAQLMGLPQELLSSAYYFPAYNNVSLDGQLRFGVP